MADFKKRTTVPWRGWVPPAKNKQKVLIVNNRPVSNNEEWTWAARFLAQRRLFGFTLDSLLPDLFRNLGSISGALALQEVPAVRFGLGMSMPGDVDLLVVPYSDGHLWLSDALAIEVKAVRASYENQGKSPNRLGATQAQGLLAHGFPRVAVIHLIASDASPPEAWRVMHRTHLLDSYGRCGPLEEVKVDRLPADLLDRATGRLMSAIGPSNAIGYAAVYLDKKTGFWFPKGKAARPNPQTKANAMAAVGRLVHTYPEALMNIPCHPPVETVTTEAEPLILDRRRLLDLSATHS